MERSEMRNATCDGNDWAQDWVAGATQTYDLSADPVLLSCEGECNESDAREVGYGYGGSQKTLLPNP
jgi:hypothetical protein